MKIETLPLTSVIPDPSNVRLHDDRNLDTIRGSLARFGQQKPIVVDSAGVIRAGNGTYLAAKSLGWTTIDVVRTTLEGLDAAAFAIADNRTSDLSTFDDASLAKLLQELRTEDALEGVGFDSGEIDELLASLGGLDEPGLIDDPGAGDPPVEPVSRLGDLWLLGGHRLLCGDSTKPDDLARLMAGEKASLLATDPPYLVDYDGTNHPAEHHKKAGRTSSPGKEVGNKRWDTYIDPEASVGFYSAFLREALVHSIERVPVYQWHATRRQALVEEAWKQNGLLIHQTIVWAKSRGVLTRSHYLWAHEPCFYGWVEGMMPEKPRRPATTATTIWQIDASGEERPDHPTPKPLEIFTRPIGYHTRTGEVCLEPFSGSGSQIIAAESMSRRCYAMELSPGFVDVAVRRWEKATGKQATLESAGATFAQTASERGVEVAA
jgi:DNA modification methylase